MTGRSHFLPGTGRWQPPSTLPAALLRINSALTEGTLVLERRCVRRIPTTILRMVPLPVSGRQS